QAYARALPHPTNECTPCMGRQTMGPCQSRPSRLAGRGPRVFAVSSSAPEGPRPIMEEIFRKNLSTFGKKMSVCVSACVRACVCVCVCARVCVCVCVQQRHIILTD